MKKIILYLASIAVVNLHAADKKPYHLNVSAGMNVFDKTSHLDNGSFYGASLSIYEKETQKYALQLAYERLSGIAYQGIVLDTDIDRYAINMVVDGDEELQITPYIMIGGGYETLSHIYQSYPDTKNQGFINAGLGFKYRLNDYFNISLEGKAIGKLDSESVDYVTKVGIDFMFGGHRPSKPKMIEALDKVEPVAQKVSPPPRIKPVVPTVPKEEKKKKWITPEVVATMFNEKDQDKQVEKDPSLLKMQNHLTAVKSDFVQKEARMTQKLTKLETALQQEQKKARIVQKEAALKVAEEKKKLEAFTQKIQSQYAQQMQEAAKKIAKAEKLAAALKAKQIAKEAEAKRLALAKIAAKKRAEEENARKLKQLLAANGMSVFSD